MRIAVPIAMLACLAASPALATQGLRCAPERGAGPVLNLTLGSGTGPVVVGATLVEAKVIRSTIGEGAALGLAQSWIDGTHLWLDLTDANAMRYEAKLRATFDPKLRGRPATGTLVTNGRIWTVRCVED